MSSRRPSDPTQTAPTRRALAPLSSPSDASNADFGAIANEPPAPAVRVGVFDDLVADDGARYEEGPVLGAGGMGEVRLRRDRRIGRHVAMKTLHSPISSADALPRFLREARVQGQLEHPAIPPVYEIGRDERGPWFTMKRLRGQTLSRILSGLAKNDPELRERFPRRRLLAAFLTVCDALDYAHARGVLHRDLKPSNIMLGDFGEVWVLDWGIARLVEDASPDDEDAKERRRSLVSPDEPRVPQGEGLTRRGKVVGTLQYMAPEQVRGEDVDGRADVYALGVVLYEILTLEHFRADTDYLRVLTSIADGRVAHPTDVDPSVDPRLDEICARATAIETGERYASVRALRQAVEAYLDGQQDAEVRAQTAGRIVAAARETLAGSERTSDGPTSLAAARSHAMHEALRALSVDPGNAGAQSLLVDLVERVGDDPPPGAEADVERARQRMRREGADAAILGLGSWLLVIPFCLWAGVRDWPVFFAILALDLLAMGFAYARRNAPRVATAEVVTLALLVGAINALSSTYMGPFVLVPTGIATCAMFFAMHVTRSERVIVTAIMMVAGLVPFVLEAAGLTRPAFAFEAGRLVLYPRLLELPPGPTLLGLAWMTGTYALFVALITGRLRDRLEMAERRLHHSAWHLRQLFPAAERAAQRG